MLSSTSSAARSAASWSSSMAPNTACSASWLQGAERPTYGSAIEKLSCDTDVIPGRLLPVRVAEQRRGMVSHDQRNTVVRVHLAPQLSQTPSDPQHGLRGRAAQGKNHSRLYDFQLAMKIWNTGRDLIRQGLSILGRATLDNVSDVYRLARQFDSLQDAVEQVSGLTHERSALRVLGGP